MRRKMKIECTKKEWNTLEPLLFDKYNTTTCYGDEIDCTLRDEYGEIILEIKGTWTK